MMVAVKRKHYLEAVLGGLQGRRQSVNYIPICKLYLPEHLTQNIVARSQRAECRLKYDI
jgi:hypothetical protein